MVETIPKLEDLLELDAAKKIVSTEIKCLTAVGENYGSLMLRLDVKVQSDGQIEELNLVAKTLPPSKEMQELFNCPVTFRNEIAFYKTIFPFLSDFQKEHGVENTINFAPRYFGSRPNLHGKNSDIDIDAALLLENLKIRGFDNLERTEGFNFEATKLVLADLAELHAVSLAYKIQKPEIFASKFMPFLTPYSSIPDEVYEGLEAKYLTSIMSVPQLEPYLDRLKKVDLNIYPAPPSREPFATISHNDCWVNNTMVKIEGGKPVENKLVDFQIADYGSPARDVLFFLFTSVKNHVLEEHFDELIQFYYKNFSTMLVKLNCDLELFSFEAFQKELDIEAKRTQFAHVAMMLYPIFATKVVKTDVADLTPADIGNDEPTELHKEKLVFVVEQFAKRNWI